jgi:D-cysteine desulfhydrase
MNAAVERAEAPDREEPRPLLEQWPALASKLRFERLGTLPTPVASLHEVARALGRGGVELYEKRDDLTSPIYGGNKVRTLEVLFGAALEAGATEIYATGAYGSNHAAASALHAPRVGLLPGLCVYPQPHDRAALDNLELMLSRDPRPPVIDLPHWSALPYGMWRAARDCRVRNVRGYVMEPGGAIPLGALGYVSAALELCQQIAAGELPAPRRVVLATGSNCTTAGLLLGLALAAERRIGIDRAPLLHAVRVTPWPVSSQLMVLRLASRTAKLLAELTGDASLARSARQLRPGLRLVGDYLGRGYGYATEAGRAAVDLWHAHGGHELETIYSGKAAAAVVDLVRDAAEGPTLYWATKSSAPLPRVAPEALGWAPPRMRRWMAKAREVTRR